jgi:hypothetical protein
MNLMSCMALKLAHALISLYHLCKNVPAQVQVLRKSAKTRKRAKKTKFRGRNVELSEGL